MGGGVMGGGQPRPADRPMPHYRPAPEYPPRPAHLPAAPEYPAVPHYLSVRGHPPVPDWPAAPAVGYRALPRRLARPMRRHVADAPGGRRAAVLGYLTVPVFLVPVAIYLTTLRGSGWARRHAAQAVNVWFTGLLYDLSAVIMGAMLALDSPPVALMVVAPLVAARWLVTLAYLARAARAAGRGADYAFPAWLCMRMAR